MSQPEPNVEQLAAMQELQIQIGNLSLRCSALAAQCASLRKSNDALIKQLDALRADPGPAAAAQ